MVNKGFFDVLKSNSMVFFDTNILLNHNDFIQKSLLEYFEKTINKIYILKSVEIELNNLKKNQSMNFDLQKRIKNAEKFLTENKNNMKFYKYNDSIIDYNHYFDFEIYKLFSNLIFKTNIFLVLVTDDADLQSAILKLNYNKLFKGKYTNKIKVFKIFGRRYREIYLDDKEFINMSNIRYKQEKEIENEIKKIYKNKYEKLKAHYKNILEKIKNKEYFIIEEQEEEIENLDNNYLKEDELQLIEYDYGEENSNSILEQSTDLFYCLKQDQFDNIKYAFNYGYNLLIIKDEMGLNLLHNAIIYCKKEIIDFLLNNGFDLFDSDDNVHPPIYYAVENLEMLEFLKDYNLDYNQKNKGGYTILHWAVESENEKALIFLLENGADIDIQDNKGLTPLHYAIKKRNEDLIRLFIKKGASLNIKTSKKEYDYNSFDSNQGMSTLEKDSTPLDYALILGLKNLINLLKGD